jgi:hypothetical protein
MLTDDRRAEIEAMLAAANKAKPFPWRQSQHDGQPVAANDVYVGESIEELAFIAAAPTIATELLAAYDDAVARLDRMAGLASSASQCLNRTYTDESALHDAITKALDDWDAVSATRARIMARVEGVEDAS